MYDCSCRRAARRAFAATIAAVLPFATADAQPGDSEASSRRPAESRDDLFLEEPPLGDGPWVFDTAQERIRVSVVARGLEWPWSVAMLPGGDMLITERVGRLRVVRDGMLDPQPIEGVPEAFVGNQAGLLDVVLHPEFARNGLVYLSYAKADAATGTNALAIARGRLDGHALVDVEDVFVADAPAGNETRFAQSGHGGRMAFGRDGTLFVTSGDRTFGYGDEAQDPANHSGAVLRLNDDGSVPSDNPFVGMQGYAPAVYSYGHRNPQGLAIHPETGIPWISEHGPQGGDELNVIRPGRNYGWPRVSHGRGYDGAAIGAGHEAEGRAAAGAGIEDRKFEPPIVHWSPAIGPSGLAFYTGDAFPAWKGSAFIGGMGRVASGHLDRQVFTDGGPIGGEIVLGQLQQRIRDVRQGRDAFLYVLTEYADGALLRIEPATERP